MKTKQKDQLQDKNFTFGSKGSTSGRLMPEFYVRDTFMVTTKWRWLRAISKR
jgi:ABC-type phosphate/phosphonate transport system substrate-binding protein